jgi:hypothetical protein
MPLADAAAVTIGNEIGVLGAADRVPTDAVLRLR